MLHFFSSLFLLSLVLVFHNTFVCICCVCVCAHTRCCIAIFFSFVVVIAVLSTQQSTKRKKRKEKLKEHLFIKINFLCLDISRLGLNENLSNVPRITTDQAHHVPKVLVEMMIHRIVE